MDNQNYTINEVVRQIGEVKETLNDIKIQTTATNGRVNKLETRNAFYAGGIAVLCVLFIPILIFSIEMYIGNKTGNTNTANVIRAVNQ